MTDFVYPFEDVGAPQDPVVGSILFTAESAFAPITRINGIDLAVNGYRYRKEEVGFINYFPGSYVFGGTENGVDGIASDSDDFFLNVSLWFGSQHFGYAVKGADENWLSTTGQLRLSEQPAEVPEPSNLMLLLAGASGLVAVQRRWRRV